MSFSKNKIVIGLGFGDEGKGMFVDYLCSHSPNSLVIRFNGGHQVSHTVVTDKFTHMFSNFGSGTLRGCPTYWSDKCTVNPEGLINELGILTDKEIQPKLYIDERCPITTPYDILYNIEEERKNKHGSCGVGFGATIEREEKHYSLTFFDLFYPSIFKAKMKSIQNFYNSVFNLEHYKNFYECCKILTKIGNVEKVYGCPKFNNYIYEGAQGLLLDKDIGIFPNVTRSNTDISNILGMIIFEENEIFLVTRAYQTRHGNGFITNENIPHNILDNPLESNIENIYQGKFRKTLLDLSLLEYGLEKEKYIKKNKNLNLVITCLDHIVNDYRFTYKEKIINCSNKKEFIKKISDILKIKSVYISKNSNSKYVEKYEL